MSQILPWKVIEIVIAAVKRSLLYGPPGTGKTTAAKAAAKKLERPSVSITLTDETPAAELRGHWIPVKGNEWVWMHGPAINAFLNGWVLILDEIDKASDDCFDFLHGLLNDNSVAEITLPNGETVTPHPDFMVIATMNGTLEDLPEALRDRFREGAIEVTDPHPNAIESLPEDLRAIAAVPQSYDTHERPATLRAWKAFAHLRDLDEIGEEIAAKVVFGNRGNELIDAIRLRGASAISSVSDDEKWWEDGDYYRCVKCDTEWYEVEGAIECFDNHDDDEEF